MPAILDLLTRRTPATGALLMAITTACWGGNFVIGRWAAEHVPPMTLSFARWGLASLAMLALAAPHLARDWPVMRANWRLMLLYGVTGTGIFNALQYLALNYTSATTAGVINSSGPVLIVIACYLLFGDRVRLGQAAGITVSLVGVLVVIGKGSLAALAALGFNVGDLFMLTAMLIASAYAAYMRLRPPMHATSFALATFVVAAVLNLPLMAGELMLGGRIVWSWASVAAMGYVSMVAGVIAYLCFNRGIEVLGGARAGVYLHLIPLFTSIFAMIFLGERPQLYHVAGFALILAGIWLAARTR